MNLKIFLSLLCITCLSFSQTKEVNETNKTITSIKKTRKRGIDIQKVMDFPMRHILDRYKKDYKVTEETAKLHEKELKRYLIIAAENLPEKNVDMFSPEVDNLWHTFLLFTREYQKFCCELLGIFVHHTPKISEE
jgi:hypothetical protein